jgi:ElaB/YqjD/DUF883 family membrane-anchored ribosome-binding protein
MKTEAHVETIVKDLKHLSRDAEDLVKATAGDVSDKAREARNRLMSAIDSARETFSELQGKARNGTRATDKLIRHNPYQTAGIAFGIGLLIGVVATLRKS